VTDFNSIVARLAAEQKQALLALPAAWGVAIDFDDAECPISK
jgi:hypothetical protein